MKYMKRLRHYVHGMRPYLVTMAIFSALTAILIILQAHALSQIVNGAFLEKLSLSWHSSLIKTVLLLLVVIGSQAMLTWFNDALAGRLAGHVKVDLRQLLFEHLLARGPRYVQGERSGELVNTAVEGVESLDAFFRQLLPQLFLTSFVPLIVLTAVTLTDWLSGLVLILTAPLLPIFLMLIGTAADAQAKRQWQQLSLDECPFPRCIARAANAQNVWQSTDAGAAHPQSEPAVCTDYAASITHRLPLLIGHGDGCDHLYRYCRGRDWITCPVWANVF